MQKIGIIGGGAAGARSAERLRGLGYEGDLVLFAEERRLPYDRPPLSKAVLLSAAPDSTFALDYAALEVDVRLGERVHRLEKDRLSTDRGTWEFDGLVIASGSEPRRLAALDGHPNAHYLRTVEDAERIRRSLQADVRVVVVGAGWIGAEVASTAARLGCEVAVVEQADGPAGALPGEIGAQLASWYEPAGIRLVTRTGVVGWEGQYILLSDGSKIRADLVVAGIGGRPALGWLAGSPIEHDHRGVLVDSALRTNVPGIVAAGDAVSYPSAQAGGRITIGHRDDAYASAEAAVRSLMGSVDSEKSHPFDPVPYFWSEQFGRMVQMAGWVSPSDELIWRRHPDSKDWAACWVREGTLRAVFAVDRGRDIARARRLLAQPHQIDIDLLSDPTVAIAAAVK